MYDGLINHCLLITCQEAGALWRSPNYSSSQPRRMNKDGNAKANQGSAPCRNTAVKVVLVWTWEAGGGMDASFSPLEEEWGPSVSAWVRVQQVEFWDSLKWEIHSIRYQSRNFNVVGNPVTAGTNRFPDWLSKEANKSIPVTFTHLFKTIMNSCNNPVLLSAASVTLGCFSELKGNMLRHQFLSKEVCNDKSCQIVGLSGQSVVLAFSVIIFPAVSTFLSPLTKLL